MISTIKQLIKVLGLSIIESLLTALQVTVPTDYPSKPVANAQLTKSHTSPIYSSSNLMNKTSTWLHLSKTNSKCIILHNFYPNLVLISRSILSSKSRKGKSKKKKKSTSNNSSPVWNNSTKKLLILPRM